MAMLSIQTNVAALDAAMNVTNTQGKLPPLGKRAMKSTQRLHRGSGDSTYTTRADATRETPSRGLGREANRTPVRDRPGAVGSRRGS